MYEEIADKIRNIGIIAHIDAGKTTLSERILYYTNKISYMGEVHQGTATMDYMPEEQERGITISSACTTCYWKDCTLNIIDTPGHVDFTIEVERSLRVLDSAIAVFCALSGVQAQSEYVWKQSEKFALPKIIFINKIDRIGASFENTLQEIRTRLKANAHPFTLPYTDAEGKDCILDLLAEKKLYFDEEDMGQTILELPLTLEEEENIMILKDELLTALAEVDELFLELYLSNNFSKKDLYAAMKRAVQARLLIPVYAGAALMNRGVQPLLDGIREFLPSAKERKIFARNQKTGVEHEIFARNEEEFCALVFKIMLEEEERISFLRIYSGTLQIGDRIYNVQKKIYEEVKEIVVFHADKLENREKAFAGEVVGIFGLENAQTADSYTLKTELVLENIFTQPPVLTLVLEAINQEEALILNKALTRYSLEDPTLHVALDEGTGRCHVSGMGELHLEVLRERLKREYRISPRAGQVQVIYKEILLNTVEAHSVFDREIDKMQHFAEISLKLSPYENAEHKNIIRFAFDTSLIEEKALDMIVEILESAIKYSEDGYEIQDVLLEVENFTYKDNFSELALQVATNMAVREALEKAKFEKIMPVMLLEIQVPEEYLGKCMLALTQIQAKVENLIETSSMKKVQARAFLSQLFGFSNHLRSLTQGRAILIMHFDSFEKTL